MPLVARSNHKEGTAPYNGTVAVTLNPCVVTAEASAANSTYAAVARQCEGIARLLKATAPISSHVRRRDCDVMSPFVIFDVNMKPVSPLAFAACGILRSWSAQNMTGP